MNHHCKALLYCCMDFRLVKALRIFMENLSEGSEEYDVISVAGAVKPLLSLETRAFILAQIDVSVELHGISEIILNAHTDCGAYGGSDNFGSIEEECEFQKGEMRKAKVLILEKHPHLNVRLVLAKIQPSKKVDFEETE